LALALFQHERINTTVTKAKEVRSFVDGIIGLAKAGTIHDRRRAFALMGNIKIENPDSPKQIDPLAKVFKELGARYKSRSGGYTRIIKTGYRSGDAAPMAILELVDAPAAKAKGDETSKETSKKKPAAKKTTKKKAETEKAA